MSRLLTAKRRALANPTVRRARSGRELARLARALSRSVLFDRDLYEAQRGRRFRSDATAAYDWIVEGSRRGLVAGPLLVPTVAAEGRRPGVQAAAWWASRARAAGFPRTTAHPLVDLAWYEAHVPAGASWRGGPLAHYTEVGRHEGARLGPLDPGGTDLVELGRAAVRATAAPTSPADEPRTATTRSALVLATGSSRTPLALLPALLDPASGIDEVLVVEGADPSAELRLADASLRLLAPRVRVLTADPHDPTAAALRAARGDTVLVVTAPIDTTATDVRRLLDAVESGAAAAVPVILAPDDTVSAAGLVLREGALVPDLAGRPWSDAVRPGDRAVAASTGTVAALRRDLATTAADGLTAGGASQSLLALTRRLHDDGGEVRLVVAATAAIASTGSADPVPTAAAAEPRTSYADPATTALRWAIKSPHPAGAVRRTWGDYHFASALAASLEQLGHEVAVDPLDSWYRASASRDDVTLTLRGLHRHQPARHQVNLLWVISHPELVTDDEMDEVDATFAASLSWSRSHSTATRRVSPLLQCTDAARFTPDAAEPGSGHPLLFVGNSRSARRPIVEAALATGHDLAIIGGGWTGRVPPGVVRAEFAGNDTLPALYRGAGVVLNDHWPAMAADGFLSNRLFDLSAAGARWVSDPARDLDEVFPQGRVASDATALRALLDGAPASFPTEAELLAASDRVRAEHSFDARARSLVSAAYEVLTRRGQSGRT